MNTPDEEIVICSWKKIYQNSIASIQSIPKDIDLTENYLKAFIEYFEPIYHIHPTTFSAIEESWKELWKRLTELPGMDAITTYGTLMKSDRDAVNVLIYAIERELM